MVTHFKVISVNLLKHDRRKTCSVFPLINSCNSQEVKCLAFNLKIKSSNSMNTPDAFLSVMI